MRRRQRCTPTRRHARTCPAFATVGSIKVVRRRLGHTSSETTQIYIYLFAQDWALILKAMNQAVSRLYVDEETGEEAA